MFKSREKLSAKELLEQITCDLEYLIYNRGGEIPREQIVETLEPIIESIEFNLQHA
jgi:hypothetical protein